MSDETASPDGKYQIEMLQCRKCKLFKALHLMKRDARNTKRGYSSFCKECHTESTKAWQRANRDKLRKHQKERYKANRDKINQNRKEKLKHCGMYKLKANISRVLYMYKMPISFYYLKLQRQGNACEICRKPAAELDRRLSVDHDHSCCKKTPTCGKCNRGLICSTCNFSLHSLEKDKSWTLSALAYLKSYE